VEIARQAKIIVNWNGKNITDEISRFINSVTYTDHEEESSDEINLLLDDGEGLWSGDWYPEEGDTVELLLGYTDKLVNCGLFQVDEITFTGAPDQIEIKAIAAGITQQLRTRNSKAFEEQTLRQVALYFCKKHGFSLVDDTSSMLSQINMPRKTQEEKTDLEFLSELAKEYGFIFSVRGNKMVFTSIYNLDNAPSVKEIDKSIVSSFSLKEKTYDTYQSAKMSVRNSKTSAVVEWSDISDNKTAKKDQLIVSGSAFSSRMAEAKVKAGLWQKNRYKQSGTINDFPGDPELVSGVNFDLTGFRNLSGKYHITTSSHRVTGDSAYTTSIDVRKTGTILKPKQVPKSKSASTVSVDPNVTDYEENLRTD